MSLDDKVKNQLTHSLESEHVTRLIAYAVEYATYSPKTPESLRRIDDAAFDYIHDPARIKPFNRIRYVRHYYKLRHEAEAKINENINLYEHLANLSLKWGF